MTEILSVIFRIYERKRVRSEPQISRESARASSNHYSLVRPVNLNISKHLNLIFMSAIKNVFLQNFVSKIVLFLPFQLFCTKMLKKHILTSVCSGQHPNTGQNIQQLMLGLPGARWAATPSRKFEMGGKRASSCGYIVSNRKR